MNEESLKDDADIFTRLFKKSLLIRLVEQKIIEIYPYDKIQSPVHLSIGQEAIASAVCDLLSPTDLMFCTYRSHAFYIAKGGDLGRMFAELYGKSTGGAKGKAGSMHLTAPEVGLMGSSAVVASSIPHAVGAALAAKLTGRRQVVVAVFGDGATEEGVYHESMNFAALHKLPVVFLCENNGLAVHSALSTRQSYGIAEQAAVYGITVARCDDGFNPIAVHEAFAKVLARLNAGDGPQFLEVKTYRYKEHVGPGEDFGAGYRNCEERDAWMARDPLIQRRDLIDRFLPDLTREIEAALAFAEASPWPSREELLTDVL